jgi:hypothetical protein
MVMQRQIRQARYWESNQRIEWLYVAGEKRKIKPFF